MPDLPGMGGDAGSYHSYCHARSLAYAVLDCVPAALAALVGEERLAWDGHGDGCVDPGPRPGAGYGSTCG